jgi:hypothetical protein
LFLFLDPGILLASIIYPAVLGGGEMQKRNFLERPISLQEGENYFLRLNKKGDGIPVLTQVIFFGYTPCPAVVIVQDAKREWIRCGRDDLFGLSQSG